MPEKDIKSFKKELKELLTKYEASIDFTCSDSSDTYGIYKPRVTVDIDYKEYTLSYDWGVGASDL